MCRSPRIIVNSLQRTALACYFYRLCLYRYASKRVAKANEYLVPIIRKSVERLSQSFLPHVRQMPHT